MSSRRDHTSRIRTDNSPEKRVILIDSPSPNIRRLVLVFSHVSNPLTPNRAHCTRNASDNAIQFHQPREDLRNSFCNKWLEMISALRIFDFRLQGVAFPPAIHLHLTFRRVSTCRSPSPPDILPLAPEYGFDRRVQARPTRKRVGLAEHHSSRLCLDGSKVPSTARSRRDHAAYARNPSFGLPRVSVQAFV